MDTALECMPCFMNMAVKESQLACPDDYALQLEIVTTWGGMLSTLDLTQPPPAIARHLADLIRSKTNCGDLYALDKHEANTQVQALFPVLEERLAKVRSENGDALALALELAIIGNFIDRGVDIEFDLDEEIANVADTVPPTILEELKALAQPGAQVLILGDNTGEIVLDKLLVDEFQRRGCEVTYTVRSKPVINDATMADAISVGMTELCHVVESGVDTPGTILERCEPAFVERMHAADVIVSKGQGNFEALYNRFPGIFCAFKVKCPRVARETGLTLGESAFCRTLTSSHRD
ncbi:damage-control phosphatase ARMT1 family protein [Pseudodesulfovibrio sediminis]|uniref:Damage-control phosphatase ARMT1-like metal-binding domain-containing protein n=1 Tax=Pseudodesulfovibrio sediminis TaxID=2810563 RepID=A0ABM7P3A5_9BACT|nr:ARMT1-like domain-containing protein [Pseudodesulfovibrio sediminis]BCS87313.1 hypothetical protein PSDVSF_05550 [Pseudodesulfovibrio sediminis]